DTLLGILAHSTLSLGLVVLALTESVRVDLLAYLFGDLLAITRGDLAWMLGGLATVMVILAWLWRPLLSVTVHEELARVEGLPVSGIRLALMLLIAIVIAVAMKAVGALLITSLRIIPPAAAQRHARTPEQMALGASALGCPAAVGGLALSWQLGTPAGPCIGGSRAGRSLLPRLGRRGGRSRWRWGPVRGAVWRCWAACRWPRIWPPRPALASWSVPRGCSCCRCWCRDVSKGERTAAARDGPPGGASDLRLQIVLQADQLDQAQLLLQPVGVIFLGVLELGHQDVTTAVVAVLLAQGYAPGQRFAHVVFQLEIGFEHVRHRITGLDGHRAH